MDHCITSSTERRSMIISNIFIIDHSFHSYDNDKMYFYFFFTFQVQIHTNCICTRGESFLDLLRSLTGRSAVSRATYYFSVG